MKEMFGKKLKFPKGQIISRFMKQILSHKPCDTVLLNTFQHTLFNVSFCCRWIFFLLFHINLVRRDKRQPQRVLRVYRAQLRLSEAGGSHSSSGLSTTNQKSAGDTGNTAAHGAAWRGCPAEHYVSQGSQPQPQHSPRPRATA